MFFKRYFIYKHISKLGQYPSNLRLNRNVLNLAQINGISDHSENRPLKYYTQAAYKNSNGFKKINLSKMLRKLEIEENSRNNVFSTKVMNFEEEIAMRREEASRTVVFMLNRKDPWKISVDQLIQTCLSYGCKIIDVFLIGNSKSPYAMIEFESKESLEKILSNTKFFSNKSTPSSIRMLYFKRNMSNENKYYHNFHNNIKDSISTIIHASTKISISDQISHFYNSNCLTDSDYRLRFFIASIIEDLLKNLFRDVTCLPFGSSINKFAAKSSDLDLNLSLTSSFLKQFNDEDEENQFYYLSKEKSAVQHKFLLFDMISPLFARILPKFYVNEQIRLANVPILKFHVDLGIETSCDLSASQHEDTFAMTKLFWTYNQLDSRVAPLVFSIRYWAQLFQVTSMRRPSHHFTNYQLTMLILYYLINLNQGKDLGHHKPVLMPMKKFVSFQDENFMEQKSDESRKVKIADLSELVKDSHSFRNRMNLYELLKGFFTFYSTFDFHKNRIQLYEHFSANTFQETFREIYIENPILGTNVAKNVDKEALEIFQKKCSRTENFMLTLKNKLTLKNLFNEVYKMNMENNKNENEKSNESSKSSINDLLTRELHDY